MIRGFPKDLQQGVDVASGKVLRITYWNQLKHHLSQDIEHGPEWGIHKGYDGPSTAIFLSSLAGRKFPASANRPGICFTISFQFGDHRWTGLRQEVQLLLLCPNTYVDSRALSPEWARTGRSFRWLGSISKDRIA